MPISTQLSSIPPQRRFHALDGWRGVCALLVALFHIPIKVSFLHLSFFKDSYMFVDFFFVLSGFVIAHAYGSLSGSANWFGFVVRRFGRLWPLHVSILAVFAVINVSRLLLYSWYGAAHRADASWGCLVISVLEHITFLQAATFLPNSPGILSNGPSWSISTEFWTYILFALITSGFRNNATGLKFLVALISAIVIFRFSTTGIGIDYWLGFFRCFYGFFLGQLIYMAYAARPHALSFFKASIAEWLLLLASITFIAVARQTDLSFGAPVVFACVVYCFASEAGVISRWLKTRPMQALGNYSYSIYMIHMIVITATCGALHVVGKLTHRELIKQAGIDYRISFGPPWMMLGFALLLLVVVVAISSVTFERIEKPGQRFFSGLARRVEKNAVSLRGAKAKAVPAEAE